METLPTDVAAYGAYGSPEEFMAMGLGVTLLIFALVVWSIVWKALAMWRAARNNHVAWYVVLLLINTMGILDILYYFIWGKPQEQGMKKPKAPVPPKQ